MPEPPLILIPPSEGKAPGGSGPAWAPSTMAIDLDDRRLAVMAALRSAMRRNEAQRQKLLGVKGDALAAATAANRTVAEEYFAVTEKVEALYDQPRQLAGDDEGTEMRKLRGEMHRRMLGNGYCARPVEIDCHFESICESCTFFVTTIEFRPTLQRQRKDAADKGQVARTKVFDGLLARIDHDAS